MRQLHEPIRITPFCFCLHCGHFSAEGDEPDLNSHGSVNCEDETHACEERAWVPLRHSGDAGRNQERKQRGLSLIIIFLLASRAPSPHLPLHSYPNLIPQYTPRYSVLILYVFFCLVATEEVYSSYFLRALILAWSAFRNPASTQDAPQKNARSLMDGTSFGGRAFDDLSSKLL